MNSTVFTKFTVVRFFSDVITIYHVHGTHVWVAFNSEKHYTLIVICWRINHIYSILITMGIRSILQKYIFATIITYVELWACHERGRKNGWLAKAQVCPDSIIIRVISYSTITNKLKFVYQALLLSVILYPRIWENLSLIQLKAIIYSVAGTFPSVVNLGTN
jgi:hypothetical protein